jgi:Recombination endonuclease VII
MSSLDDLPKGFLRLGLDRWLRFEPELRNLIVKLAREQNFRCALCSTERGLIVEHDHDPYIGEGRRPTIYNTRGIVCDRCNRHIDFYEQRERGDYDWDHVSICFSDSDYDAYIDVYNTRVLDLWEKDLQARLGGRYWRRRLFVDKFYDWQEGWHDFPWRWEFEEIKEKRHGRIRTPKQFMPAGYDGGQQSYSIKMGRGRIAANIAKLPELLRKP